MRVAARCAWYADRAAWRLIHAGYLPWLAGLNLVWEVAQLPLYTLWREASPGFVAFAVVHCTAGDVLIGVAALAVALIALRAREAARWPLGRISVATAFLGAAYTGFSEWANTVALQSWQYSDLMPVMRLGEVGIGLSPIAQWLLLPPAALFLARRRARLAAAQPQQPRSSCFGGQGTEP